eukprot:TRINITY_DN84194_c0_g1_i1.p1 TRINITY_DN84194_c0_g1~~TRINITY_DN84194_c0_g1_i1.p1  ORF type:complete len:565 (+),score=28.45 TRINITY_DN84194_c0_g1_i1:48-1697(+)
MIVSITVACEPPAAASNSNPADAETDSSPQSNRSEHSAVQTTTGLPDEALGVPLASSGASDTEEDSSLRQIPPVGAYPRRSNSARPPDAPESPLERVGSCPAPVRSWELQTVDTAPSAVQKPSRPRVWGVLQGATTPGLPTLLAVPTPSAPAAPTVPSAQSLTSTPVTGAPQTPAYSMLQPFSLVRVLSDAMGVTTPALQDTFYCAICLSYQTHQLAFVFGECGHTFCRNCIRDYVASEIPNGVTAIRCPYVASLDVEEHVCCPTALSRDSLVALLESQGDATDDAPLVDGPELLRKFDKFTRLRDPTARVCPRCENIQNGNPEVPLMTCERCMHTYCFIHGDAHNPKEACRDYERRTRTRESRASKRLISRTSKKCPKCSVPTSKVTGCNHMRCTRCEEEWCWLCGSPIGPLGVTGHYRVTACAGGQFASTTATMLRQIITGVLSLPLWPLAFLVYLLFALVCSPWVLRGNEKLYAFLSTPVRATRIIATFILAAPLILLLFVVYLTILAVGFALFPCFYFLFSLCCSKQDARRIYECCLGWPRSLID